jgi:hypothetical protein
MAPKGVLKWFWMNLNPLLIEKRRLWLPTPFHGPDNRHDLQCLDGQGVEKGHPKIPPISIKKLQGLPMQIGHPKGSRGSLLIGQSCHSTECLCIGQKERGVRRVQ